MKRLPLVALALLFVSLQGCAQRVAFDQTAHPDVHKIALLSIKDPDEYLVQDTSGAMFGVVGALVMQGATQSKTEELTAAMKKENLRLGGALEDALETALRQRGYDVVRVAVDRPKGDLLDDYSSIHTNADAILDVTVVGTFMTAIMRDYAPYEYVHARLVSVPKHEVLYSDHPFYSTGWTAQIHPADPNGKYTFGTFDEMMASPATVAASLRAGVEPEALYIANALSSSGGASPAPVASHP